MNKSPVDFLVALYDKPSDVALIEAYIKRAVMYSQADQFNADCWLSRLADPSWSSVMVKVVSNIFIVLTAAAILEKDEDFSLLVERFPTPDGDDDILVFANEMVFFAQYDKSNKFDDVINQANGDKWLARVTYFQGCFHSKLQMAALGFF